MRSESVRTLEIMNDGECICILDIPNGPREYQFAFNLEAQRALCFTKKMVVKVCATQMYHKGPSRIDWKKKCAGRYASVPYVPHKTKKCVLRKFVCFGVDKKQEVARILCRGWLQLECKMNECVMDIVDMITMYI